MPATFEAPLGAAALLCPDRSVSSCLPYQVPSDPKIRTKPVQNPPIFAYV